MFFSYVIAAFSIDENTQLQQISDQKLHMTDNRGEETSIGIQNLKMPIVRILFRVARVFKSKLLYLSRSSSTVSGVMWAALLCDFFVFV